MTRPGAHAAGRGFRPALDTRVLRAVAPAVAVAVAVTITITTIGAGCPDLPASGTLRVAGALEREGVLASNTGEVPIAFASTSSKGEWWSCDLRLTAGACVGEHHVNVWLAGPTIETFDELGQTACVDGAGLPFGVYELLSAKVVEGEPIGIPEDVSALVLVGSDIDGDGAGDLDDDAETSAASLLVEGTVEVLGIGSFDDPLSIRVTGATTIGRAVEVEFEGPTTAVANPPPLDVARTCVAADARAP